jgi:hypothetical protein
LFGYCHAGLLCRELFLEEQHASLHLALALDRLSLLLALALIGFLQLAQLLGLVLSRILQGLRFELPYERVVSPVLVFNLALKSRFVGVVTYHRGCGLANQRGTLALELEFELADALLLLPLALQSLALLAFPLDLLALGLEIVEVLDQKAAHLVHRAGLHMRLDVIHICSHRRVSTQDNQRTHRTHAYVPSAPKSS